MKVFFPDYKRCVVNFMSSIRKYYGLTCMYDSLVELDEVLSEEYKNIIIVLLDGLGSNVIKKTIGENSFLNSFKKTDYSSVFPSTTTSSTTSYLSCKYPIEHSWLGWHMYFKEIDKNIVLFSNKDYYDMDYSNDEVIKSISYQNIFDELSNIGISCYSIKPPIINELEKDLGFELDKVKEIIEKDNNKKFIYVYNHNPDHVIHEFGVTSSESIDVIKYLDKQLNNFYNEMDNDTLTIVCADHGLVNVKEINLYDYPNIVSLFKRLPSLEPRACSFTIKDGHKEEFVNNFNNLFGNDFILLSKEEVYKKKIFGYGLPNKRVDEFIGDYISLAINNYMFIYNEDDKHIPMVASHGGLLEDEMLIPLIVLNKK